MRETLLVFKPIDLDEIYKTIGVFYKSMAKHSFIENNTENSFDLCSFTEGLSSAQIPTTQDFLLMVFIVQYRFDADMHTLGLKKTVGGYESLICWRSLGQQRLTEFEMHMYLAKTAVILI